VDGIVKSSGSHIGAVLRYPAKLTASSCVWRQQSMAPFNPASDVFFEDAVNHLCSGRARAAIPLVKSPAICRVCGAVRWSERTTPWRLWAGFSSKKLKI